MEHLAILRQPFLDSILSGEKTIESRWYKFKKAPFGMIKKGEIVYFKEAGKNVSAKAEVEKALFFDGLDAEKIRQIIEKYGGRIGIDFSYEEKVKDKKFCTLIFVKNVCKIAPFEIDKKGYGNMAAWITLKNINDIRVKNNRLK